MAFNGLRKIKKKNTMQQCVMQNMPDLQGGINIFGRVGMGKTVSMLTIAQLYHDHPSKQYKIFDMWGGDRNEHLYWTLPSNKINYWKTLQKTLKLNKAGPKQYQVKLLYPMWSKLPKNIPHNPPHIKSQVFTIPFRDIKIEDLALITGTLSTRDEAIWSNILYESNKTTTPSEIIKKMLKANAKTFSIFRNSINPLVRELLLQSDNGNFNIDIKEEINDQQTISVLCLEFVPKEYRYFIMGYLVRKITEELDRKRTKTIIMIREASEIFRADNITIMPARILVLKSYMSHWMRMSRRGMFFCLDTQSPSETKSIVAGQNDLSLFGRLPSRQDRESATEQLKLDNLITTKQITQIATLEPGQFMVCPSGKKAYFQYFFLPKTRFWEEGNGNFYKSIWKNLVDQWKITADIAEELKQIKKTNDDIVDGQNRPLEYFKEEVIEDIIKKDDKDNKDDKDDKEFIVNPPTQEDYKNSLTESNSESVISEPEPKPKPFNPQKILNSYNPDKINKIILKKQKA